MMFRPQRILESASALAVCMCATAQAGTPAGTEFTYQGLLKSNDAAINDDVDIKCRLYDAAVNGTQIGNEIERLNVPVTEGVFSIALDFGSVFSGAERWLELEVKLSSDLPAAYQILSPRHEVKPAPFALFSMSTGLIPDSALVGTYTQRIKLTNTSNTLVGDGAGISNLSASSIASGTVASTLNFSNVNNTFTGDGNGLFNLRWSAISGIPAGFADGVDNDTIIWSTSGGDAYFDSGTVGIGDTPPSNSRLRVLGDQTSTIFAWNQSSSGQRYAGQFRSDSTTGRGLFGYAPATSGTPIGVLGQVETGGGIAVVGLNTDDGIGVQGESAGNLTFGTGVKGISRAVNGYGVFGDATSIDGGSTRGVYGRAASNDGVGVFGEATATVGLAAGGRFETDSRSGVGVYGISWDSTASSGAVGVWAQVQNELGVALRATSLANSGFSRGVWGSVDSPNGYAAYFQGGRNYFEGNTGIGVAPPLTELHVAADDLGLDSAVLGGEEFIVEASDAVGSLISGDGGNWGSILTLKEVDSFGNLVDNWGVARHTSGNGSELFITYGSNSGAASNTAHVTVEPNGRVGISNTSPAARLQVDGPAGEDPIRVRVDGTTRFIVDGPTGYTVLGANTTPGFQLHVAGDGTAGKPGGGLWGTTSDIRLKRNIHDLDGALDKLLALRGVTFEYIDPEPINELPGQRIGLIAQEVEQVFPDWISTGPDGYKRVNVRGLTALTVEALRDLRTEKDAEIQSLRGENDELRRRVAALERAVAELLESQEGAGR